MRASRWLRPSMTTSLRNWSVCDTDEGISSQASGIALSRRSHLYGIYWLGYTGQIATPAVICKNPVLGGTLRGALLRGFLRTKCGRG